MSRASKARGAKAAAEREKLYDRIVALYRDEGLTSEQVAQAIPCARSTVLYALEKRGVQRRGQGPVRVAWTEEMDAVARRPIGARLAAEMIGVAEHTLRNRRAVLSATHQPGAAA